MIRVNITRLEELKDITMIFHDNGMAMGVDMRCVNINLENLKVQHDNVQATQKQQLNLLKYIMDYPTDAQIALVPVNFEDIAPVVLTGLSENLCEPQLLRPQKLMAKKQKKMIGYGYIPSLNLIANQMFSAYTDKAYHWFRSGPSNHWFRSYGLGVSLRTPTFDGLDKRYENRRAVVDIENMKLTQESIHKNLQTQYLNATNDLVNSQHNFGRQKDNYLFAEDVYTIIMERYYEGIVPMTKVLQDEIQMSETQNNHINIHYSYWVIILLLLKLTGQIDPLIKWQVNQIIVWKQ